MGPSGRVAAGEILEGASILFLESERKLSEDLGGKLAGRESARRAGIRWRRRLAGGPSADASSVQLGINQRSKTDRVSRIVSFHGMISAAR